MKRYFQPVAKDNSLKKAKGDSTSLRKDQQPELNSGGHSGSQAQQNFVENKEPLASPPLLMSQEFCPGNTIQGAVLVHEGTIRTTSNTNCEAERRAGHCSGNSPCRFMSWNANSFLLRIKNDRVQFFTFIRKFDPDVIAIQEVRMPAAGRKGEAKNPCEMKDDTNASREEKQVMQRALMAPPLNQYRAWWSLGDSKYSGTGLLVKKAFPPVRVAYSLNDDEDQPGKGLAPRPAHECEGRAILVEFADLRLLTTYVPNNGWRDEPTGFKRRREWDRRMLEFVSRSHQKPLIWCGDLNVSHQDLDVSHPEFFRNARQAGYMPPDPQDIGQPGFTPNEQNRFSAILSEGNLLDSYRHLHKQKDMEAGFTWSGNPVGKYRGKRMRIDYFVISRQLEERLVSSAIHGRGIEMEGFIGSDHCPITMELRPSVPSPAIELPAVASVEVTRSMRNLQAAAVTFGGTRTSKELERDLHPKEQEERSASKAEAKYKSSGGFLHML